MQTYKQLEWEISRLLLKRVSNHLSVLFQFAWLYFHDCICISKTTRICQNQQADFVRFLFKEDSLEIKNDLELVSRSNFCKVFGKTFVKFFGKTFPFVILYKLVKFHYQKVNKFKSYSVKCICFMLTHLITSWKAFSLVSKVLFWKLNPSRFDPGRRQNTNFKFLFSHFFVVP